MRSPRRILAPFDNSDASIDALAYARTLAGGLGAALTAFMALGGEPATGEVGIAENRRADAERLLDDALAVAATRTRAEPAEVARAARWGDPATLIAAFADEVDADLLVMGTHGRRGLARAFLGSVTASVLRRTARPVLTLHALPTPSPELPRHLLVATDLADHSAPALEWAMELAPRLGASVTLTNVVETPLPVLTGETSLVNREIVDELATASGAALAEAASRFSERGVVVRTELREGDAGRLVPELASEIGADLVVLGTRGRQGIARALLGSVAERVRRDAPMPVLVVRGDG